MPNEKQFKNEFTLLCRVAQLENLTEFEKGFVTGVFEGEGCICVPKSRDGRVFPKLSISNTYLPLITYLQELIGGHINQIKPQKKHHKVGYVLIFSSIFDIAAFLFVFVPYLVCKKEKAEGVLKWCLARLGGNFRYREYSKEEILALEEIRT